MMASSKIKKGDTVQVITGKDKGKTGEVLEVKDGKVLVKGIGIVKKHQKPTQANPKGGRVEQEAFIDASNVMYVYKDKPTRIGFKLVEGSNGKKNKVRIAKSTGEEIDG
jgi:large subunit ribosomal protein L24